MLMSELERRAQIEETWARRAVYADAMAEERMAEYVARRDLARLGSYGFPEPETLPRKPTTAHPAPQIARGFNLPAFPVRQVAIAHYTRSVSPDSIAALVTGLQSLVRNRGPAFAGQGEPGSDED